MSGAERPAIRSAIPEDYPAIAELLDRVLGERPYAQRLRLWTWRYDENPTRAETFPPFLVLEQGSRIVGAQGLIPILISADGRELRASCSCDLAVDPSARSAAGLKLKLAAMSKELSPLHLSTSANEAANRITLALGGKEISAGRRKLIKPLKASGLMMRTRDRPGSAGRVLRSVEAALWKPADWALAIRRAVGIPRRVADGNLRDVRFFDARFDRFWERTAKDGRILVVRDAGYLNWRYVRYPFPGVECFELNWGGELAGYGVIHHAVDEDGLRFAAMLELETRNGERAVAEQFVGEAIRRAAGQGAHYLIARPATPQCEAICRRLGFLQRDMTYSSITYKMNLDVSNEGMLADRNWYMTLGDGDGCHYFSEGSPY